MSTIYYWQKLAFSKRGKYNSLEKNLKKYTSFEEQKLQGIFGKLFGGFLSSAVFHLQNHVSKF